MSTSSFPKRQSEDTISQSPKRGRPAATSLVPSPLRRLLPKPTLPGVQPTLPGIRSHTSIPTMRPQILLPKKLLSCNARKCLADDFEDRKAATLSFSPHLSVHSTRNAIKQFQSHLENVVEDTKIVCLSCGLFISSWDVRSLHRSYPLFLNALHSSSLIEMSLDICGIQDDNFNFCMKYYRQIVEFKPPKFGSINSVNVYACQNYPNVLGDFTLVEEGVIARAHPVISILKLRPSGTSFSASYQRIRGHAVVLPQNPGPLLTLLPSPTLQLHDVIRVVWASKRPHTVADIRLFGRIRKRKILDALTWLKENNTLYQDISINHDLLDGWNEEFVPVGISSRVLKYDPSHEEREGYAANFDSDNYENKLHHALGTGGLNDSGILSGCLYTDVYDTQENPTMKLVLAVTNHKRTAASEDTSEIPILTYENNGRPVPLNDWENPDYFTSAFPTLFPFVIGCHLTKKDDPRKSQVSLQAWGKWALLHHSRRYDNKSLIFLNILMLIDLPVIPLSCSSFMM